MKGKPTKQNNLMIMQLLEAVVGRTRYEVRDTLEKHEHYYTPHGFCQVVYYWPPLATTFLVLHQHTQKH